MKPTPYPGYDVLAKWNTPSWNDATREVMARRLREVPPRRFFTREEAAVLEALCRCAVPQLDRAHPVPIAPRIDAAMAEGRSTGTRHRDMPEEGEAWRRGLAAFDAEARHRHDVGFAELGPQAQEAILSAIDAGEATEALWQVPPQDFQRSVALRRIVQVYYAHPAAMSEIGYGGPASPRGYVRLNPNRADPWEARFGDWRKR
jgi:hypothetical protein